MQAARRGIANGALAAPLVRPHCRVLTWSRPATGRTVLALTVLLAGCTPTRGPGPSAPDAALSPTITRLTASLRKEDSRESAHAALVAIGEPAIPALSEMLGDPDPEVRLAAIETLEKIQGAGAVDALLIAVRDADGTVRLRAVEALGALPDRRAVPPLMARYGEDDDDQVRYEILTTLGKIGDPRAGDLLVAETRSSDRYARMWAVDALCAMRDARAPALAASALQDPERYVRQQVLRSCDAAFDTAEGHAALIQVALSDPDFESTVEARRQLRTAVTRPQAEVLREQIRAAGLAALGGPMSTNASFLLAEIGDSSGAAVLRRALADPNVFVRHHAAFYLGQVGGPDAVPALIAALDDPQPLVAATAHDSLLRFAQRGDRRAQGAVDRYQGKRFETRLPR